MSPEELIAHYPRLYHMAVGGSWPKIRQFGLLSTISLLDLFEVPDALRSELLTKRRPESVEITHPRHGRAVVRDQKPLIESKLAGALTGGTTVEQWLQLLNERVFFWVSENRLNTLLNARAYRAGQHDVITLDTAGILRDYEAVVHLSAMNTGNTQPIAHPRGADTFKTLAEYPFSDRRRRRLEPIVEFTVLGGVSNVDQYVVRVDRWDSGRHVGEIAL